MRVLGYSLKDRIRENAAFVLVWLSPNQYLEMLAYSNSDGWFLESTLAQHVWQTQTLSSEIEGQDGKDARAKP